MFTKNRTIIILGGLLAFFLIVGADVMTYLNSAKASENPFAQIETNMMSKGNWDLNVTKVQFLTSQGKQKSAQVTMEITNPAGRDIPVVPSGYVAGVVGVSGKVYHVETINAEAHRNLELGEQVKRMSDYLKTQAEKQSRVYEPGLFRFTMWLW